MLNTPVPIWATSRRTVQNVLSSIGIMVFRCGELSWRTDLRRTTSGITSVEITSACRSPDCKASPTDLHARETVSQICLMNCPVRPSSLPMTYVSLVTSVHGISPLRSILGIVRRTSSLKEAHSWNKLVEIHVLESDGLVVPFSRVSMDNGRASKSLAVSMLTFEGAAPS